MWTERSEACRVDGPAWEHLRPDPPSPATAAFRSALGQAGASIGLDRAVVDTLVARARIRHLRGGRTVCVADGRGDAVHFLVAGAVRTTFGKTIVRMVPPGSFVDPTVVLGDDGPRRFGGVTHMPCVVAEIGRSDWQIVLASLPAGRLRQLASHVATTLAAMAHHRVALGGLPLGERVRLQLTALAQDFGRPHRAGTLLGLPLTHHDVARMIVGTRANVTRAYKKLCEEGWMTMDDRQVVLCRR